MKLKTLLSCLFFSLQLMQLAAQQKSAQDASTLKVLPDWYWNNKMQAHTITLHNFFRCGLHHYDGDGDTQDDCIAGSNCNDCYVEGIYSDYFNAIGAGVVRRTIRGTSDGAIWCSSVGGVHDGKDPLTGRNNGINIKAVADLAPSNCDAFDFPKRIVEAAGNFGIKQIFYYRTSTDPYFSEKYPEWKARDYRGAEIPFSSSSIPYLCINSPYNTVLEIRASELIASGASALYFDNSHNPRNGCWCGYCKSKFTAEMGGEFPVRANDTRLVDYYNRIIYRHINSVQKTIHETDNGSDEPSVLIASTGLFVMLNKRDVYKDFVRLIDVPKSEYDHSLRLFSNKYFYSIPQNNPLYSYRIPNSTRLGFSWTVLRDYATHRTFSAWIQPEIEIGSSIDDIKTVPIPPGQLTSYLGAAYAFGFIIDPSLYVNSSADTKADPNLIIGGAPAQNIIADYKAVFDIDKKIGPAIGAMKPVKWNAILFDADMKNKYLTSVEEAPETSFRVEVDEQIDLWMNYLIDCHAAFEAVKNYKFPAGSQLGSVKQPVYVLDHQDFLAANNLQGIANIVVPNRLLLSGELLAALNIFAQQDDHSVVFLDDADYYNKNNTAGQQQNLLLSIQRKTQNTAGAKAPIYASASSSKGDEVFVEFYENTQASWSSSYDYVVTLTNDISWSVPLVTRRSYVKSRALDFSDHPDDITNLSLTPPQSIPDGVIRIHISPKLCKGLLDSPAEVLAGKLRVYNLQTGDVLDEGVEYDSQNNEFVIDVPAFEMIAALGIQIDGDCDAVSTGASE